MTTLYDFTVRTAGGAARSLSDFAGQVLLVVNTASECGYTKQYAGLQELQDFFAGQGFSVLGFPCNQFGGQEPGSADEILAFCQGRFGVSFPVMAKLEVNGDGADPLWRWLTQAGSEHPHPVKWNFTKFLIDARGRVVKRYEPAVEPYELVDDVRALLAR
ncbi:glutathione peroxidase [Chromobacterium sphagni]|uniref:Glutathione peroxidase n=1 Tax=Chromobacterium sphagni TaxID=1903179 RepID=A0A1S1X0H0_9NEIS|nr:glutathione peroxidase [Chromobacterium sphagni]OHX12890.1 glutathione peroxidase [Chromobacterium sphagni]OHX19903.1 glutathione peroxidase [Chromobacterium sphagni]